MRSIPQTTQRVDLYSPSRTLAGSDQQSTKVEYSNLHEKQTKKAFQNMSEQTQTNTVPQRTSEYVVDIGSNVEYARHVEALDLVHIEELV